MFSPNDSPQDHPHRLEPGLALDVLNCLTAAELLANRILKDGASSVLPQLSSTYLRNLCFTLKQTKKRCEMEFPEG